MKLFNYIEKYSHYIIIVLLVVVLFLYTDDLKIGKMVEGFESTVANSVSVVEQKFNQAFGVINATDIQIKQNLNVDGNITGKNDIIAGRNLTATGNVNAKKDLNATGNVYAKKDVNAARHVNAQEDIKGKRVCIGKTCITSLNPTSTTRYSSCQDAHGKDLQYLDRQNAQCSANEYLSGFQFGKHQCSGSQMQYKLTCRKLPGL